MEEPREGDIRVPLISSLFCLCVSVGGVLLFVYVFVPSSSKSWFPVAAFLLIGSPWIFWVFTYIYTCIKACVRSHHLQDRQISRRSFHARSSAAMSSHNANNIIGRNNTNKESLNEPSTRSSNDDAAGGKHVHFGGVVVHDGESSHGQRGPEKQDSSVTSSKEIEMPLTSSV